jgi:hypothetical protein
MFNQLKVGGSLMIYVTVVRVCGTHELEDLFADRFPLSAPASDMWSMAAWCHGTMNVGYRDEGRTVLLQGLAHIPIPEPTHLAAKTTRNTPTTPSH